MTRRVIVVGAGVIGLTCAVRLAEAGLTVDVLARDLPAETTSALAGGLWLPFLAEPLDDVMRWARTSLEVFAGLEHREGAGVRFLPGHLLHRRPAALPRWASLVADVVPLTPVADPAPGYGFGFGLIVPLIDPPRYLGFLRRRLEAAGGTLTRLALTALPARGLVVDCTGLAARALAADPSVHPVRGQTVVVADPGLTSWLVAEPDPAGSPPDDLVYVLPRGRDVVIGGTVQPGDWSTTPDPATGRQLLARACALVPDLRSSKVLAHRVGLRPVRPTVRLETEHLPTDEDPEHAVVHCYGHGGCGIGLSWGCADDVLREVLAVTEGVRPGG
jgi:D-amino-acid oxidase